MGVFPRSVAAFKSRCWIRHKGGWRWVEALAFRLHATKYLPRENTYSKVNTRTSKGNLQMKRRNGSALLVPVASCVPILIFLNVWL